MGCDKSAGGPVVVVLSPAHAPAGGAAAVEALQARLTALSGVPVKVQLATTSLQAIEAFGGTQSHIGLLPVTEYLFARQAYGVEARLQVQRAAGARYVGEIVVTSDSKLKTVGDLTGKRIAYTDEFSTSGFLLPAALVASQGVKPKAVFAGSHEAAVAALRAGDVDAAATYGGVAAKDAKLKVLATTEPIPNEPVFVAKGVDPARAKAVLDALAKVADEGGLTELAGITSMQPIHHDAYASLLERVRAAGRSTADLVPGGRAISLANEPILGPSPD